jgi:hypothetical protein
MGMKEPLKSARLIVPVDVGVLVEKLKEKVFK